MSYRLTEQQVKRNLNSHDMENSLTFNDSRSPITPWMSKNKNSRIIRSQRAQESEISHQFLKTIGKYKHARHRTQNFLSQTNEFAGQAADKCGEREYPFLFTLGKRKTSKTSKDIRIQTRKFRPTVDNHKINTYDVLLPKQFTSSGSAKAHTYSVNSTDSRGKSTAVHFSVKRKCRKAEKLRKKGEEIDKMERNEEEFKKTNLSIREVYELIGVRKSTFQTRQKEFKDIFVKNPESFLMSKTGLKKPAVSRLDSFRDEGWLVPKKSQRWVEKKPSVACKTVYL